ncbi:MAG: Uma2 family endonuclease [Spirulina sp. SIO3F2]|nr:Uma2 family endonuclease [Spirulina sp. SIO3F2]
MSPPNISRPLVDPQTATPTKPDPAAIERNERDVEAYSVPEPDISHLVLEDEAPVDNLIQEKLQRLLVQCLYSAYRPGQPFLAMADVGIFFGLYQPPIVPDVMLSLGVEVSPDWHEKKHRSYLVWEFGKVPEVVIEIVSNRKGNELTRKLTDYAQMGIPYYVVFDPLQQLSAQLLQAYILNGNQYQRLPQPQLPSLGLGLTIWSGKFEGKQYDRWLRWCDLAGNLLLTGDEQALLAQQQSEIESLRAEQEKQRAEAESRRAEQQKQRAEQEKQRAEAAARRARKAEKRAARLAELLKAQGIELEEE